MSVEYIVHIDKNIIDEIYPIIVLKIQKVFPKIKMDSTGLWLDSGYDDWLSFSMEKHEKGLFIVENISSDAAKLFEIIEKILKEKQMLYSIEDI